MHLGCFHVLAVVNTAAMNTGMHVTFQIRYSFFMTLCPEWDWGSYGSPNFSFLGTSVLFSMMAAPISIAINSVGGFPSLHTLSSFCYL